jgi:hypothetical protein
MRTMVGWTLALEVFFNDPLCVGRMVGGRKVLPQISDLYRVVLFVNEYSGIVSSRQR